MSELGARPVPVLTSLTSVQKSCSVGASAPIPRPLSSIASSVQLEKVERWAGFLQMVQEKIKRVNVPSKRVIERDISNLLKNFVNPALEKYNIELGILEGDQPSSFVGRADLVICDMTNGRSQPIFVGYRHPELAINSELSQILMQSHDMAAIRHETAIHHNDIAQSNTEAMAATKQLCATMLINNVRYGLLMCKTSSYFVDLQESRPGSVLLKISRPVHCYEHGDALLAVLLDATCRHDSEPEPPFLEVTPESVKHPDVSPLSSYEDKVQGEAKWWIAFKMKRQKFFVKISPNQNFSTRERSSCRQPSCHTRQGVVVVGSSKGLRANILMTETDDHRLARMASMLQYLNQSHTAYVPRMLVFGRLFQLQTLAVEWSGRTLTSADLSSAAVVQHMHSALHELHEEGVMLGETTLDSFLIQDEQEKEDASGPFIRILGLSEARLVRRVPQIARDSEHARLAYLIEHCIDSGTPN